MSAFTAKKHFIAVIILPLALLAIHVLFPCPASEATAIVPSQHVEYLRESILLLAQARDHAQEDYSKASRQGTLDPTGQHDYQLFIEYLDSRIRTYCRELYELGNSNALTDLPCSYSLGAEGNGNGLFTLPLNTAGTTNEQIAELDDSLNVALGQFDDMLLKEQETLALQVPRQRENGSGSSRADRDGGTAGQKDDHSDGAGQEDSQKGDSDKETSSQDGEDKASSEDSRQAEGAASGTQETSRESSSSGDHLDGSDDDIVARQLREAAEKETDPEIKKKLWEEYKKYKEGTR